MAVGMTSHLFHGGTTTSRFSQINKFRVQVAHSLLVVNSIFIVYFISVCSPPPPPYRARRSVVLSPCHPLRFLLLLMSCDSLLANPVTALVAPAVGIIVFALWGFLPLVKDIRNRIDHGGNWKQSPTYLISRSYLQPLLLWTGATLICRGLDPVVLRSSASQAVKTRLVTFVRSLSTVLAVAYVLTSLIQQVHRFLVDVRNPNDTKKMGLDFTVKAIYTGIWIAAVSLFMELLGVNTKKWITAGGFGTVLLTLAGREILTNFISSVMINASRPFIVNEWITANIDGVEITGVVERVGMWSPTVLRGDDKEAIYIPNHKFTVSIVRNNTRRSHWRIKSYLAISHMDAGKISIIVADMRKVLAKNQNIEQQRLHRRVFFEKIDETTQALMIYVSCFVKTSHLEEYLNVQEEVLLDFLRIVGHHRARLATQTRTVQKSYGNADIDNIPFGEEMYTRVRGRPLLIDTSAKVSEGKSKSRSTSREDQRVKTSASAETRAGSPDSASVSNSDKKEQKKIVSEDGPMKNSKNDHGMSTQASLAGKGEPRGSEATERQGDGSVSLPNPKKESRPGLEDNIVLGVALDGSKRTLPIEQGTDPHASESEQGTVEVGSLPKDKKGQSHMP
ncbi:mechanosensitive ion channel protein 2, chloroplastic isoform X3 [Triticum aestivum]|uniref:mechanosensitive ion channel protein 2, chloroplastic isoform X3 n=1 Tax=Triticum aestivum TaxID=4565 RepID=UPI001D02A61B|nr:mechanosensitive ion channel protein 2, chloroplastic-like isoform X3 [Triticum aestivum]